MKERRAAAHYAKALFELAKERDQTGIISRELGTHPPEIGVLQADQVVLERTRPCWAASSSRTMRSSSTGA